MIWLRWPPRSIEGGADVIGMAGGDGSQGAVAAVAAEHDIPYVCVPAGTRNHFAIDIGVARDDVVGALDVFVDGTERRIDLARVNGRIFVNNASMGLYGAIVQSPAYREREVANGDRDAARPRRTRFGGIRPAAHAPGRVAVVARGSSCWCRTTAMSSTPGR